MDTDLQLGYEIYDRSYEINAVIQAVVSAASRNYVIQSDDKTKSALTSLQALANQFRTSPVSFFTEIANAASSRGNTEAWHVSRIRSLYANHDAALKVLLNATGPLSGLNDVTNVYVVSAIRTSLLRVQDESQKLLSDSEEISRTISQIRANSSLLVTPDLLDGFIGNSVSDQISSSLISIRNSLSILLLAVRDAGRLIGAHGSVHELLSRSFSRDTTTRNTALSNFVNNYNRVRNNLLSSVASYRQAAENGIINFIARVQSTYTDTIVRYKFDTVQLPLVQSFANIITSKVYNQTFFQDSFDEMRDAIINSFTDATNSTLSQGSEYRDVILTLQRTQFVRRYSHCLNELVTEAQQSSNTITGKYAFCLNERTSGIVVVIPSTSTWLSVIKDNINFILQQLNACLNGQTSVAGRTATSDCIQYVSVFTSLDNLMIYDDFFSFQNANNLAFYSSYLPITVESNLQPITQNTPAIFQNCVGMVPASIENKFGEVYAKCKAETEQDKPTTTTTEVTTTTEDPEDGSGSELTDSYILV